MNRQIVRSFGFLFASAALSLTPHVASAQSEPTSLLSADEVRSEFISQGFQVGPATSWWTSNHVSSFRVSDPVSGRVLMVLLYPDSATADAERAKVQARETDDGGRLVPGYGPSTWLGNMAMVESTNQDLARQYAAEQDRDNQLSLGLQAIDPAPADPTHAVDADFLAVVEGGTANL